MQEAPEDEALLSPVVGRRSNYRELGAFIWAAIATALVIVLAVLYQHQEVRSPKHTGKRNLIFMVSDGMGPTSLSLTRSFQQSSQSSDGYGSSLILDRHLIGSSRTRSTSSLITDSAAGATAFSCGKKSYNGAISMLPDHSPCGTVMEAAKLAGYTTGLVVTTRITDATPACFAAHVDHRQQEDLIAEQLVGPKHPLGRVVDLMLGGGRCHFLPNSSQGSCREDNVSVIEPHWTYISSRNEFDHLQDVKLPLLGLFADTDIPYEVDRREQTDRYPSLKEMTLTALQILEAATKQSNKGFFVMIEGSRIDHAGHGNDPVAQVHEVLAYDAAFAAVLEFLGSSSTPGVVVSTSDHETGGLATARQLHESYPEYLWHPDVLANASASSEFLDAALVAATVEGNSSKAYIRESLVEGKLGIYDASEAEIEALYNASTVKWPPPAYKFADMVSRRAQVGWTSHGHSAVDVNIYSSDIRQTRALAGNHENTEVGDFLRDYLGLDLEPVTKKLQGGDLQWTGGLNASESTGGRTHLAAYHGDFKRSLACDCFG